MPCPDHLGMNNLIPTSSKFLLSFLSCSWQSREEASPTGGESVHSTLVPTLQSGAPSSNEVGSRCANRSPKEGGHHALWGATR